MRSVALAGCLAALVAGCPTADKPEHHKSGLVKTVEHQVEQIDPAKATKQLSELLRAIAMPHHRVGAALGAHKFSGTSTVEVLRGDKSLNKIEANVVIEVDAKGNYRAIRNLSGDYGREVIFAGGTLYLRPRYSKYHRRAPETKTEPVELRNEFFSTLAAYMQPLAHVVDLGTVSEVQLAGREAYKIELSTAAKPRARPSEGKVQREWRETITGGNVSGHVVLDKKTAAPLAAKLNGEVTFRRKGERLRMKVSVNQAISDVGKAVAIAAPPADQTVDTLQRRTETDERDQLLKGIAPPAGKTAIPSN